MRKHASSDDSDRFIRVSNEAERESGVPAKHIYAAYPEKIYKGKLPPLVHGIVVVEMELDANGQLKSRQASRVISR